MEGLSNTERKASSGFFRQFLEGYHKFYFLVELVSAATTYVAYWFFAPHGQETTAASDHLRQIRTLLLSFCVFVCFTLLRLFYTMMKAPFHLGQALTFGKLASGFIRGWVDDKPQRRTHKVLIVADASANTPADAHVDEARKDFDGGDLAPISWTLPDRPPAQTGEPSQTHEEKVRKWKKQLLDEWISQSKDVDAVYLFRSQTAVDNGSYTLIYDQASALAKTQRNQNSPILEANLADSNRGIDAFERLLEKEFPVKVNKMLARMMERAALLSAQAAFNRFVVFVLIAISIGAVVALRLPLFSGADAVNSTRRAALTDAVNGLSVERLRLETRFPMPSSPQRDNTLIDLQGSTKESLRLLLTSMKPESPLVRNLADARLTVWREASYKDHVIAFAAGATEDPKEWVFRDDPLEKKVAVISGAFRIHGWVLWRKNCPAFDKTAAWAADGSSEADCNTDATISIPDGCAAIRSGAGSGRQCKTGETTSTEDPAFTIAWEQAPESADLTALLCFGDEHGNGACIGVLKSQDALTEASLRQDVASWTKLIAGRPNGLLFGEDAQTRADASVATWDVDTKPQTKNRK